MSPATSMQTAPVALRNPLSKRRNRTGEWLHIAQEAQSWDRRHVRIVHQREPLARKWAQLLENTLEDWPTSNAHHRLTEAA